MSRICKRLRRAFAALFRCRVCGARGLAEDLCDPVMESS